MGKKPKFSRVERQLNVRLTLQEMEALEKYCKDFNVSKSDFVRRMIRDICWGK